MGTAEKIEKKLNDMAQDFTLAQRREASTSQLDGLLSQMDGAMKLAEALDVYCECAWTRKGGTGRVGSCSCTTTPRS